MKNRDLKLSLEVVVMSLPVLLQVLQLVLQPMLQTTGESGPSRGLLKTQGSQGSCNRGHQRHEGGPIKGLPMVTHYHSHKSGPIWG